MHACVGVHTCVCVCVYTPSDLHLVSQLNEIITLTMASFFCSDIFDAMFTFKKDAGEVIIQQGICLLTYSIGFSMLICPVHSHMCSTCSCNPSCLSSITTQRPAITMYCLKAKHLQIHFAMRGMICV